MLSRTVSSTLLACVAVSLTGCTLLPLKKLQPTIAPPEGGTCSAPVSLIRSTTPTFGYVLPADPSMRGTMSDLMFEPGDTASSAMVMASAPTFEKYDALIASRVQAKLGDALSKDPVVVAFRKTLESVSGEVQLDAQIADGTAKGVDVQGQFASIHKQSPPAKLTHTQLKNFSNKLFTLQLKHGAADLTTSNPNQAVASAAASAKSVLTRTATTKPAFDVGLVAYLKAYYDGKFYDRMSAAVSKPQLPNTSNLVSSLSNFSVPDSEIVAAETVLLEFLMDTIDPTPVMGDTKCPIPSTTATASCTPDPSDAKTTTYYPGKSSNQPTALTVGYAKYVQLPATGCGITTKNVWVLQTLASGASDEAATVGGLVANTPGGVSIGLGIVGKISIGDNATLSDLVKTAASEVALRTTLLSSYFSLYRVNFTPISTP